MKSASFTVLVLLVILMACKNQLPIGQQNLAGVYEVPAAELHHYISLFRYQSQKLLISQVNSKELLFTREKSTDQFSCRYLIRWSIYQSASQRVPSDSGRVIFQKSIDDQWLSDTIKITWPAGGYFWLDVKLFDLNRKLMVRNVERINASEAGFYFLTDESGLPAEARYLYAGHTYTLHQSDTSEIVFSAYSSNDSIAPPPFVLDEKTEFNPQDLKFNPVEINGKTFTLKDTNAYVIEIKHPKSAKRYLVVNNAFPEVSHPSALLKPLRYLTSTDEFKKMLFINDDKKAVDQFWLEAGGNKDRARELIKLFYKRVIRANELFTGAQEGWASDAGMIYLIFGPPDRLYDSDKSQLWVYIENGRMPNTTFEFIKSDTPYGTQLKLIRDRLYKPIWYLVAEAWRNGYINQRY